MDAAGGSEVFARARSALRIDRGLESLACVRLSAKGLHRWYAACCRTPLCNSLPSIPYVGVLGSALDPNWERDEVGPSQPINTSHTLIPLAPHSKFPLALVLKSLRLMFGWWYRERKLGSVLFDAAGKPTVNPLVLSATERAALRSNPLA
jgi:hypothetical protein